MTEILIAWALYVQGSVSYDNLVLFKWLVLQVVEFGRFRTDVIDYLFLLMCDNVVCGC